MFGSRHAGAVFLSLFNFSVPVNTVANTNKRILQLPQLLPNPQQFQTILGQVAGTGPIGTPGSLNPFGRMTASSSMNVLILDTETTGVGQDKVARSIAGIEGTLGSSGIRIGQKPNVIKTFFRQPGLEAGVIQTSKGPTSLAVGANMLEGARNAIDVINNPQKAQEEMIAVLKKISSYDRLIGKNIAFDIEVLRNTAAGIPGAEKSEALQEALKIFDEKVNSGDFAVDIDRAVRLHLGAKFDEYARDTFETAKRIHEFGALNQEEKDLERMLQRAGYSLGGPDDLDESMFRNALYARKIGSIRLFEELEMSKNGRGFTANAMNNIAATTNLFELIYNEALGNGPNSGAAETLMRLITGGSHVAETDDYLAAFVAQYTYTGQLTFSPENLDNLPVDARNFVRAARNKVASSASPTLTTNIADVSHLTSTSKALLRTAKAREQLGVQIQTKFGDVLSDDKIQEIADNMGRSQAQVRRMVGRLRYNRSSNKYEIFSGNPLLPDGDDAVSYTTSYEANQSLAKQRMRNVIDDAFSNVASREQRVAAASIVNTGLDYAEQGYLTRASLLGPTLKSSIENFDEVNFESRLGSIDSSKLVEALTNTARTLIYQDTLSLHESLSGSKSESLVEANMGKLIRSALESGSPGAYAKYATMIGNPYGGADMLDRARSTQLSLLTSETAREQAQALASSRNPAIAVGQRQKQQILSNFQELSEFGMSAFKSQDVLSIMNPDIQDTSNLSAFDRLQRSKLFVDKDVFGSMKVEVLQSNNTTKTVSLIDAMTNKSHRESRLAMRNALGELEATQVTGAQLNKFGFSVSRSGRKEVLNVFMGGQDFGKTESRLLSESLLRALNLQIDDLRIGSSETQEAAETVEQLTGRAPTGDRDKQLRAIQALIGDSTSEDDVIEALAQKIRDGGLVAFKHDFVDEARQVEFMEKMKAYGIIGDGNDTLFASSTRLVDSTGQVGLFGHLEDTRMEAVRRGVSFADQAAYQASKDERALTSMEKISELLTPNIKRQVQHEREGIEAGRVLTSRQRQIRSMYQQVKKPSLIGLGAVTGLGAGYYMYNKHSKSEIYDETLEQQTTTPARAPRMDILENSGSPVYTRIQDPMSTAGLVGNLDKSKIGHTKMSSDKYNNLFGM